MVDVNNTQDSDQIFKHRIEGLALKFSESRNKVKNLINTIGKNHELPVLKEVIPKEMAKTFGSLLSLMDSSDLIIMALGLAKDQQGAGADEAKADLVNMWAETVSRWLSGLVDIKTLTGHPSMEAAYSLFKQKPELGIEAMIIELNDHTDAFLKFVMEMKDDAANKTPAPSA